MSSKSYTLNSPEETELFAAGIGSHLKGGECIELKSDLGGGKTTFTRGLVAGSGSNDKVSSPTFTVGKQYISKSLRFYHFDFYRLSEPGLVAEELSESLTDDKAVIVVEWGASVKDVLPEDRVIIELNRVEDDADARICTVTFPDAYIYLLEGAE